MEESDRPTAEHGPLEPPAPLRDRVPSWVRSNVLHNWIQSIGIVVAATWGAYTFIWKEILVPEMAPASLSLEITVSPSRRLRPTQTAGQANLELELEITASNSSSRNLYLLPSIWQMQGVRLRQGGEDPAFAERATEVLYLLGSQDRAERFAPAEPGRTLSTGWLFLDDVIHPGEKLSRNLLLRLPAKRYQAATFDLLIPALTQPPKQRLFGGRTLRWSYDPQAKGTTELVPNLCPRDPSQDCVRISLDALTNQVKAFDPKSMFFKTTREVPL
ncbi:hypothetical protein I1E95_16535 [Synechococcus sp. CBW1107]|uniref:hypothetical protein n=1 Tax=Synechococcus sp. CBW1107 TaxID=2789857 RepID=UPI0018CC7D2A|nr:hypothetical protein [Synechococcus sp. CBW1107]QPN56632.1 hypothetical protein I1E95_16535 [Synechococcus sp. CBW1107]